MAKIKKEVTTKKRTEKKKTTEKKAKNVEALAPEDVKAENNEQETVTTETEETNNELLEPIDTNDIDALKKLLDDEEGIHEEVFELPKTDLESIGVEEITKMVEECDVKQTELGNIKDTKEMRDKLLEEYEKTKEKMADLEKAIKNSEGKLHVDEKKKRKQSWYFTYGQRII